MRRPGQHGAAAPELMPQEQACCAFLTFGTRPGTLTITAPEEARQRNTTRLKAAKVGDCGVGG